MAEKIVTLISDRGAEVLYKRYGARIPLFLAEYPPKDGYRVVIEMTDLLSLQKGRMALLREAINAGKKPCDVGLPGIENDVNTLVCTARLLDPQERVIRSASASMKIEEHKDLEALETAANQRLLAALDFGGEMLDEDEDRDLAAQGLSRTAQPQTRTTLASSTPDTFEQTDGTDLTSETTKNQDENDNKISAAERRMIENLARRVNQPVPPLQTRADVKKARQALNALARQQRHGASAEAH
ncbi:hypothetical protein [Steroidobacter sp.]|uniref:hypothetical protein n=1 Tax=Steroidobacter sp. TaxID=1978227 RepID=UPI001A493D26|nr:hypothetical protein [Steroidobacter sp.]MBL8269554.1 hypothetical protein [Steroidobacter sp.]